MIIKRTIKRATARVPLAQEALKRAWMEARRLGERSAFALSGPPDPATTLLLASSGRSGSTWLGDMLAATPGVQQIFEPLDPRNSAAYRQLINWPPDLPSSAFKRHYLHPHAQAPAWRTFWADVLQGRVRTYLTDYARTSFFPSRFLVKTIRANMMLGFIDQQFHSPIILLARHPGAVLNSMFHRVRAPWPADVQDILAQEALVEDHLRPWLSQIEGVKTGFEALAVWWAVENRVAFSQLAGRSHYLIFYEHLALQPQAEINRLLRWLGVAANAVPTPLLHRYSRMTSVRQRTAGEQDVMQRLTAWQRELSAEERRLALTWAERLQIPWYGPEPLPHRESGPRSRA